MPSEDAQLNQFYAGRPTEAEMEGGRERETETQTEGEGEGEAEGSEGEGMGKTGEEEVLQPPRAKKSRSQLRALDVQTLQVHVSPPPHTYNII